MPNTVSAGSVKSESGRNAIVAARMISRPPIVGVPCFARCVCGPSSRMCCPNSFLRRNPMNVGPLRIAMIIATSAATRTLAISRSSSPRRPRVPPSASPSRARRHPGEARRAAARLLRPRPRPTPRRTRRASPPTAITCSIPSSRTSAPISAWYAGAPRTELRHLAEHRDAPAPGGRARPGARARRASRRGSRCSSRSAAGRRPEATAPPRGASRTRRAARRPAAGRRDARRDGDARSACSRAGAAR